MKTKQFPQAHNQTTVRNIAR